MLIMNKKMVDHFRDFSNTSLNLKKTNFSNLSRWAISLSRKILREIHKELHNFKMKGARFVLRLDSYSVNFYNSMRPQRKLHNLSPDDSEYRLGLNGIQKSLVQMFNNPVTLGYKQKN